MLELGQVRDQQMLALWGVRRLKVERDLGLFKKDPSLPISFKVNLEFEAGLLDRMLARVPERARIWGVEAEQNAIGSLRMIETLLYEIRAGIEPELKEVDKCP